MSWGYEWRPYVSVREKIRLAARFAAQQAKQQKREACPVQVTGRKITTTFWGDSWCKNLESYSDYANRLPRGARYLRNGSVVDLVINPGQIDAVVAGSEVYTVKIEIEKLKSSLWSQIRRDCSSAIDSLLDLLAGRFSDGVMQRLTRQKDGLFPSPNEIKLSCSCPDWSDCCKHLAAVMYAIGARLDAHPELLFVLRDVDHQELVSQAVAQGNLEKELSAGTSTLAPSELGDIFGIDLDVSSAAASEVASEAGGGRRPKPARARASTAAASIADAPTGRKRTTRSGTAKRSKQPEKKRPRKRKAE